MTQPGTGVALPADYETGLEDFDASSAALPRIQIVHEHGVFVDKQTNEEFPLMYGVFLGLVAQRVFWAKELENDSKPLCKSNDGETGYPNVTGPAHSLFPWPKAGLNPQNVPKDEHGRPILKCEGCPFAEWGPRTAGKATPPPCSERYTMPVLFSTKEGGALDHAGLISVQRSGISSFKNYIGAFKRAHLPLFAAMTKVTLDTNKRGNVTYSTPKVARMADTDQAQWQDWAEQYRSVREMLRRPPAPPKDDDGAQSTQPSNNSWGAQGAVVEAEVVESPWEETKPAQPEQSWPQTQPAAQPVMTGGLIDSASSQPAPAATSDDDDLPF